MSRVTRERVSSSPTPLILRTDGKQVCWRERLAVERIQPIRGGSGPGLASTRSWSGPNAALVPLQPRSNDCKKKDGEYARCHAHTFRRNEAKTGRPYWQNWSLSRVWAVRAVWSQSVRSKENIIQVHPELPIFGQNSTIFKWPPVASLLTEHVLLFLQSLLCSIGSYCGLYIWAQWATPHMGSYLGSAGHTSHGFIWTNGLREACALLPKCQSQVDCNVMVLYRLSII